MTRLANGTTETSNTARDHQVVITNTGGEEQIVDYDKAALRYTPTGIPDFYEARGIVRAIDNPLGRPIEIVAPWGEIQYGNADCKVVALFDPNAPLTVDPDRYIIAGNEFSETYRLRFGSDQFDRPLASGALMLDLPTLNTGFDETPNLA